MKKFAGILFSLFLAQCLSAQLVFQHTTNSDNTSEHVTTLDHLQLNSNPKAVVFVAPVWEQNGDQNPAYPFGVWYDASKAKWAIFNQNKYALPVKSSERLRFNVLTYPESNPNVFVHTVTASNRSNHVTTLDHSALNNKPDAVVLVTQAYGAYNDHEIGVWYDAGRWKIFNQDKVDLPNNAKFNVLIATNGAGMGGSVGIRHNHTAASKIAAPNIGYSALNDARLNNKPNWRLFVTQRWIGQYNPYTYNIWYDSPEDAYAQYKNGSWFVYNSQNQELPLNTAFNILAVPTDYGPTNCPAVTASFEDITRSNINTRSNCLSAERINGSVGEANRLTKGTVVFYKTNEGRLGKMEILACEYDLRLRCVTYNPNGSIFRKRDDLTIKGTYSCDLDYLLETTTGQDFFWQQASATERYLTPTQKGGVYWVAKVGGNAPTSALKGWVDLHTHPMSHLGFGRKAMHGAPGIGCIIPAGTHNCNPTEFRATSIDQALGNCNSTHGGWGTDNGCGDYLRAGIINYALDDEFEHKVSFDRNPHGDHEHGGYPGLGFWPNHTSILHQQMWTDWIRRARDGGLRVMVALTVNSELLAEIINGDDPYDDKTVADIQIDETVQFVNNNRSFMEIAYSRADLERIVNSDKIAVVLGMEVDKIGNFGKSGVLTNEATVRAEMQRLYNKGIRYVFPIHLVDNSFGGAAVYEMLFNFANKRANGRHFSVTTSSDPNVQYRANLTDGPLGFENGLILGVRGFLEGLGQLPAPCFNDAIKCFPPPGKIRCCGSYERILGVMAPAPEFDTYKFVPGGHVNSNGLTPLGEAAIDELMKLGMMIDIDHMLERSMTRTIEIAERRSGGYPLVMGHNGIRGPGGNERGAPIALVRRVAALGGMIGTGTAKATHSGFTSAYRDLWRAMGNRGVAIGSDANGFEPLPHRAAGKGNEDASRTFYNTFFAQSGISAKCKTGDRTWDYVKDGGVSHYGIMPEFFHEVKLNGGGDVIENLNTSAGHFAQMWAKCERLSTSTAAGITEINLAGISSDIHNNDCKKFYGTVELEVWQTNASGTRTARVTPVSGGGLLINWDKGPGREVSGFPGVNVRMPNQLKINLVYALDRTLLDQNRILVVIKTKLGSAHKGCDTCTDFTWDAAMPSTREQVFYLRSVLNQLGAVKSMVVGPYAASDGRHSIRVHFEVR